MEHANPFGSSRQGTGAGNVVCAFEPGAVDPVRSALDTAGFRIEMIDVVRPEDVQGIEAPLDPTGVGGFVERLALGLGGGLNELERARRELAAGHVLLIIPVVDDEEALARLVTTIQRHGGHTIIYFERWTVKALGYRRLVSRRQAGADSESESELPHACRRHHERRPAFS
jgi:hypothetical protein